MDFSDAAEKFPATDSISPPWNQDRSSPSSSPQASATARPNASTALDPTRQLGCQLYTLCDLTGWAEDARAYNEIITGWPAIEAAETRTPQPQQIALFVCRR